MRFSSKPFLAGACALALLGLAAIGCGQEGRSAKVKVKFDMYDGDNVFAATVYAQEVSTGETTSFPYAPHIPYIVVEIKKPGSYVFYARLVEAPDDYHYGYTSGQTVAYGHMTRGGTQDPAKAGLIALKVEAGGSYEAYINDYRAILPDRDKPVTVPWRLEE
jgi:hypothetical protein